MPEDVLENKTVKRGLSSKTSNNFWVQVQFTPAYKTSPRNEMEGIVTSLSGMEFD